MHWDFIKNMKVICVTTTVALLLAQTVNMFSFLLRSNPMVCLAICIGLSPFMDTSDLISYMQNKHGEKYGLDLE